MPASSAPAPVRTVTRVRGRYRLENVLGEGGVAIVYAAVDERKDERVALKRLRPRSTRSARKARQLFEAEFQTLASLCHPRVVQVRDFGSDGEGPFYTMELLDGGDLESQGIIDWRTACALMRDVCSVLSLLHSRGMVHGDVTPPNIRCTRDGLAKLLDFGAMAPMGPCKQVVGTPTTCAPEVLDRGELSARTDLYALGCTLYFALTGHYPYPAHELAQLPVVWTSSPARPGELVEDIPKGLDGLVMNLIRLDPAGRPESAAEVMERLGALAGLPHDEQLNVSRAYLASPELVGHGRTLGRLRQRLERAHGGHGSCTLIEGDSGLGRTRVLQRGLLQARFANLRAVEATAADGLVPGGVLSALGERLLAVEPELARQLAEPHARVLGTVVASLRDGEDEADDGEPPDRAALQEAYRAWVEGVCTQCPLAIAVDDADAIDELSASVLALLALRADELPLALLLSARPQQVETAAALPALLLDRSTRLPLSPLTEEQTEQLLGSMFGCASHLRKLAHRLHGLAEGNPRDVVSLAEHLLQRGVVRYEGGAWHLPPSLEDVDLPRDMSEAVQRELVTLDATSLALARVWALAPELTAGIGELCTAAGCGPTDGVVSSLEALQTRGWVRAAGECWTPSRQGWLEAAVATIPEAERTALHRRLVETWSRLGDELRAASHAFEAGDLDRGLDLVIRHAESTQATSDEGPQQYERVVQSLPHGWLRVYERALDLCEARRGTQARYLLLHRASSFVAGTLEGVRFIVEPLRLLKRAAGLDLLEELEPQLEPGQRAVRCLQLAQQRYEQTAEEERVMPPAEALRRLAGLCVEAVASCASTQDQDLWAEIPCLSDFSEVSPALGIVDLLREGIGARISGRFDAAAATYQKVLTRLSAPEGGGLAPAYRSYTQIGVACGLAMMDAQRGADSALTWASQVGASTLYAVPAQLARGVHCLWQGDAQGARQHREQAEVQQMRNGGRRFRESGHLPVEISAHAASDDLVQLKAVLPDVERMAAKVPAFEPVAAFARGEFQRIRGTLDEALAELEYAAGAVRAGGHQMFAEIVGAHLRVLNGLGETKRTVQLGTAQLAAAEDAGVGYTTHFIRMPLAIALAHRGQAEQARAMLEWVLDDLASRDAGALLTGLAHEAAAHVAIMQLDAEAFARHAAVVGSCFRRHGNRALIAKHSRLVDDARDAGLKVASTVDENVPGAPIKISTVLSAYPQPQARAQRALELMLAASGATSGALFAVDTEGPALVARLGANIDEDEARQHARAYLLEKHSTQPGQGRTMTESLAASMPPREGASDVSQVLQSVVVGHTTEQRFVVTGLALFNVRSYQSFRVPMELAVQLSRYWHELGDAVALGIETEWPDTDP